MDTAIDRLQALIKTPQVYQSKNAYYGISLTFAAPTVFSEGRTQGYRLFVQAGDGCHMGDEIFVYQRKPILYDNANFKDDFTNIASVADLEEYPVGAPVDGQHPFFRLNFLDLIFRNFDLLAETLVSVNSQVWELCNALECNRILTEAPNEIRIGAVVCGSSSSLIP